MVCPILLLILFHYRLLVCSLYYASLENVCTLTFSLVCKKKILIKKMNVVKIFLNNFKF